jgi:hypothetical protein
MECTNALDLLSESRLRTIATGLGERSASHLLTQGEIVPHSWSRALELRTSSSFVWPS